MKSFTQTIRAEVYSVRVEKKMDKNRAFVRDCFLVGGVISNPLRTYHLEFTLDATKAERLAKTLINFDLHPKNIARGGQSVVYLKEAEEIAEVLRIIMANKALLAFEEMRVKKSLAGNINRRVNFEAANLNKTVSAAQAQIDAIKYIKEAAGLMVLSPPLQKIAQLRLENESASLSEIGEMLDPPIGKSGVNHRLRKICKIASELVGKDDINDRTYG